MRGASAETVEPLIVLVIAMSSWIRLSRERVRDSVIFALTGAPFAYLSIGLVCTRAALVAVFYVDCVARILVTMCSSRKLSLHFFLSIFAHFESRGQQCRDCHVITLANARTRSRAVIKLADFLTEEDKPRVFISA